MRGGLLTLLVILGAGVLAVCTGLLGAALVAVGRHG